MNTKTNFKNKFKRKILKTIHLIRPEESKFTCKQEFPLSHTWRVLDRPVVAGELTHSIVRVDGARMTTDDKLQRNAAFETNEWAMLEFSCSKL